MPNQSQNDNDNLREPIVVRTARRMARRPRIVADNPGTTVDPAGTIGGGEHPLPPDIRDMLDNVP